MNNQKVRDPPVVPSGVASGDTPKRPQSAPDVSTSQTGELLAEVDITQSPLGESPAVLGPMAQSSPSAQIMQPYTIAQTPSSGTFMQSDPTIQTSISTTTHQLYPTTQSSPSATAMQPYSIAQSPSLGTVGQPHSVVQTQPLVTSAAPNVKKRRRSAFDTTASSDAENNYDISPLLDRQLSLNGAEQAWLIQNPRHGRAVLDEEYESLEADMDFVRSKQVTETTGLVVESRYFANQLYHIHKRQLEIRTLKDLISEEPSDWIKKRAADAEDAMSSLVQAVHFAKG